MGGAAHAVPGPRNTNGVPFGRCRLRNMRTADDDLPTASFTLLSLEWRERSGSNEAVALHLPSCGKLEFRGARKRMAQALHWRGDVQPGAGAITSVAIYLRIRAYGWGLPSDQARAQALTHAPPSVTKCV